MPTSLAAGCNMTFEQGVPKDGWNSTFLNLGSKSMPKVGGVSTGLEQKCEILALRCQKVLQAAGRPQGGVPALDTFCTKSMIITA